jgi:hypothetical protein
MAGVDLHAVGELLGRQTALRTKRDAHRSVNRKQVAMERVSPVQGVIETATCRDFTQELSRKLL